MKDDRPVYYQDVEKCVDSIIQKVGKKIVFGMPLGLGKPNQFANELYRRAKADPSLHLTIMSALALEKPTWSGELERRFMQPFVERVFGDYVDFDYVLDLRKKKLPPNVEVVEFFMKPGGFLNVPHVQQNYINSNYTHACRDIIDNGINVVGQLVSKGEIAGKTMYSLSCNSDTGLDIIPLMRKAEREGQKIAVVGQVNTNLPFMYGDAVVEPELFDVILDGPYNTRLFGAPRMAIADADFMIGMYVSALIKDGGTLQIGIGSLGDAIAYALKHREQDNEIYRQILGDLKISEKFGDIITRIGGTDKFEEGLIGSTEMFVEGYLELVRAGVVKRKTYNNVAIQRLVNDKKIDGTITPKTLEALLETGAIQPRLTQKDFDFLCEYGIFKDGLALEDGHIRCGDRAFAADLSQSDNLRDIAAHCLGDTLKNDITIHGGFFLGTNSFYEELRNMSEADRRHINMTSVLNVNQLYGNHYANQELKTLQRRHGRFANTALMCTLSGSIVSDGLENGQVVSGVGGQFDFVAQAHALPDARLIIMLRSTRSKGKQISSNIVWNYGHITVPRHMRDLVVTEYGIADLRGKSDKQIIMALLNIADSRFQEELLQKAKDAQKIPSDYRIPETFRANFPEKTKAGLTPFKKKGMFPAFPYGCDFTKEELVLGKAFTALKAKMASSWLPIPIPTLSQLKKILSIPPQAMPYLQRMQLDKPTTSQEKKMQKLVVYALSLTGAI